jgi:redox-sensitive bicupin YhaK (pirin superfamily)
MITVYPYENLGRFNAGWLEAHYHFSFANYYNPARMGFGPLRVINDDIVKAGGGFDMHPHANMEIITYVRQGAITHRDSLGHEGRTAAGDVQVMSAGTGIIHGEYNLESEDTRLYQIWIEPNRRGVMPRWGQKQFPKTPGEGLKLLVSGLPEHADSEALPIYAEAAMYGGVLGAGEALPLEVTGGGYLLVSQGEIELYGAMLRAGDGIEIHGPKSLSLMAPQSAELVYIDLPTYLSSQH